MKGPDIPVRDFLANMPMFRGLAPEEIERLAVDTRRVYAARGETLFNKGDVAEGFHVVLYGRVKLGFTSPQGAEKVVEILGPGMSFGEAVMFMERPYPVFAQAIEDSLLMLVPKAVVFAELDANPRFARKLIAGMAARLHALVRDVESYSLRSGTQRVVGFLLAEEQRGEAGTAADGTLSVTLPATKVTIASRLNLTPEHFSRILHDLAEAGLIRVDGRVVHVPDLARLRAF
jgi:CRP-like cAMP-binding protein